MPLFASDIFVKIIDDYDDIPGKFRLKDKTSILFYSGKILKIYIRGRNIKYREVP